jgi:hypothetical protein
MSAGINQANPPIRAISLQPVEFVIRSRRLELIRHTLILVFGESLPDDVPAMAKTKKKIFVTIK